MARNGIIHSTKDLDSNIPVITENFKEIKKTTISLMNLKSKLAFYDTKWHNPLVQGFNSLWDVSKGFSFKVDTYWTVGD